MTDASLTILRGVGEVDITSDSWIMYDGSATVYGGYLVVLDGDVTVYGGKVLVYGGTVEVRGGEVDIHGGTAKVYDGMIRDYTGTSKLMVSGAIRRVYRNGTWTTEVRGGKGVKVVNH